MDPAVGSQFQNKLPFFLAVAPKISFRPPSISIRGKAQASSLSAKACAENRGCAARLPCRLFFSLSRPGSGRRQGAHSARKRKKKENKYPSGAFSLTSQSSSKNSGQLPLSDFPCYILQSSRGGGVGGRLPNPPHGRTFLRSNPIRAFERWRALSHSRHAFPLSYSQRQL